MELQLVWSSRILYIRRETYITAVLSTVLICLFYANPEPYLYYCKYETIKLESPTKYNKRNYLTVLVRALVPKLGIVLLDIVLGPCIILHCFRIFSLYVVVDLTRSQPFNRSLHLILWVTISELTVARSTALRPRYVILDPRSVSVRRRSILDFQYLQLLPLD